MASRIGLKPLAELCRRTATSHATGIDARKTWGREAKTGGARQQAELGKVSEAINRGSTLTDALRQTDGFLPELMIDMVDVGEQSGRLDESLNRLGAYYEQLRTLRTAFLAGIAWPAIQLGLAVVAIGLIIWIMGLIGGGNQGGKDDLNTDILGFGLKGNQGLIIYITIVGSIAAVGYFGIRGLLSGSLSNVVMAGLMRTPGLGPALSALSISRMAWALGMTFESGLAADKCVDVSLRSTQNAYFKQHSSAIRKNVRRGETLYSSLIETNAFPQDFLDAVMVGEETGRMGESMEAISRAYEQKGKLAMQGLALMAGFAVWGLVGLFIVFMIFRIAYYYVGLIQDISTW